MKPLALQICAAAFAALLAAAAPARGAGTATNRWVRAAGKDARASVAENWSLGHAPRKNEVALFTARHPTAAVWDAAAPREIGGLVLDEGYLSVLTFETTAGRPVKVDGDVDLRAGALTHPQNGDDARWSLQLRVGGSLRVGPGAIVSATAKGFAPGKGPAPGLEPGWGASHGGQGAPKSGGESGRPALVCGSIFEPAACGSGGTVADGAAPGIGHGGGAIRIDAGGDIEIYGAIRADGDGRNPGNVLLGGAAGGSIDLRAGGRFRWGGDFAVSADGGPAFRDGGGGGGGGRIALRASDEKSDIESCPWSGNNAFFNAVHAWGGTGDTRSRDNSRADVHVRAAPGTVYCEHAGGGRPAGGGSILVRGNHPPGLATTRLPSDKDGDATLQDAEVVLSWGAFCTLGASCTVRALHVRSDQAGFSLNRSVLTASEVSSGDRRHVLSESGTYRGNTDDALVPILFDGGTLVLRPYFKPAP